MTDEIKLPLNSTDVTEELLMQLREAAPQIFSEGRIDFTKLQAALGEHVETNPERYGLTWAGKRDAFRNVQVPSVATLRPQPEESVNWDSTENLIIEGDNLEVLKLLQKSYHGKVKMIYIDPPYNTGNEFIYPDNFREGLDEYLRYTQQLSEEGTATSTNKDTCGRYHSNWLNMMYPRLFLARNLLREDGVIFVSIDDHEVHNLRLLLDEVFGEENFLSENIIVANKRGQTYKEISKTHEYLLIYSKNPDVDLYEIEKDDNALPFNDSKGAFDLWELRNRNPKFGRFNRPNLFFPIYASPSELDENGYAKVSLHQTPEYSIEIFPVNSIGTAGCWRWSKDKVLAQDLIESSPNIVAKQRRDGGWNVYEKSRKSTTKAKSLWDETEVISEQGTVQLGKYDLGGVFDHPKPVGLISKALKIATLDDDIVLDFFAGSGTTAEAALQLNHEDDCNRKFILVQLPEKTDNPQYPTIAHITRERVRRVIAKLKNDKGGQLALEAEAKQDCGFRAFKLDSSNFKIWQTDNAPQSAEQLAEQLSLYADNVQVDRNDQDRLYELILKSGRPLTARVESLTIAKRAAFSVGDGDLLICLEQHLDRDTLRALFARKPKIVLCLDTAFDGNDALKTNTVLEAQSHGITFRTV
jgi:adenine-specific DNA-methyltransferase